MSPTARSLNMLRKAGYIAGVVEKWIPMTRRRLDLFGFIDVVAIRGTEVVGIQVTSGSNVAARIAKIRAVPEFPVIAAAMRIEVHGWRKVKVKRGGKAVRWECRTELVENENRG